MQLRSLKIGVRLGSAFAVVLVLMVLAIGVTLANMASMNERTEELVAHDY